jgi:hypothetical protein
MKYEQQLDSYSRSNRDRVKQSIRTDMKKEPGLSGLHLNSAMSIINVPTVEEEDMTNKVELVLSKHLDGQENTYNLVGLTQQQVDELYLVLGYVVPRNNSLLDICGVLENNVSDSNFEAFNKIKVKPDPDFPQYFNIVFDWEV